MRTKGREFCTVNRRSEPRVLPIQQDTSSGPIWRNVVIACVTHHAAPQHNSKDDWLRPGQIKGALLDAVDGNLKCKSDLQKTVPLPTLLETVSQKEKSPLLVHNARAKCRSRVWIPAVSMSTAIKSHLQLVRKKSGAKQRLWASALRGRRQSDDTVPKEDIVPISAHLQTNNKEKVDFHCDQPSKFEDVFRSEDLRGHQTESSPCTYPRAGAQYRKAVDCWDD